MNALRPIIWNLSYLDYLIAPIHYLIAAATLLQLLLCCAHLASTSYPSQPLLFHSSFASTCHSFQRTSQIRRWQQKCMLGSSQWSMKMWRGGARRYNLRNILLLALQLLPPWLLGLARADWRTGHAWGGLVFQTGPPPSFTCRGSQWMRELCSASWEFLKSNSRPP